MDLDSTTNKILNFYSLPFTMFETETKRTFEFFDREYPEWINSLSFDKYGEIEYRLMNTTMDFDTLKDYINSIRPTGNTSNKKERKIEKGYSETLESFLEFSRKHGKEIFDKYCEQSLVHVE